MNSFLFGQGYCISHFLFDTVAKDFTEKVAMISLASLTSVKDFVKNEFSKLKLNDVRLEKRIIKIVSAMNEKPSESIPAMNEGMKKYFEAFYRFFRNRKVSAENLLQTHFSNTIERMCDYKGDILLAFDTCIVSPAKHMDGLKSYGKGKENGVRIHYGLAVSADGKYIFGIVSFRYISDPLSKYNPDFKDESDIWKKTAEDAVNNILSFGNRKLLQQCIFVGDREADDFELMSLLKKIGLKFIIRAQYNRKIIVESKENKLFLHLKALTKKHGVSYTIKTMKNKKYVEVIVQRSVLAGITLPPPSKYKDDGLEKLELNMVVVEEVEDNDDPVSWKIWTDLNASNETSSEFIVESYTHRWSIEEVNKAAKTGVKIEERQFGDLDHFIPFLAVAFVIGWRLLALRTVSEITPDTPIQDNFDEDEVEYLKVEAGKKGISMRTVKDATFFIARLGGFTGAYARPGWIVLWKGWVKFTQHIYGYSVAKERYMKLSETLSLQQARAP